MKPIGVLHSCFKDKFGIPRQPGLIKSAVATLELLPPFNCEEAIREIEGFSHIWVVFVFHESMTEKFQPTVRPPRLGGNRRVGVFATRSPFRPNPIGLSVVELKRVNGTTLELSGGDFLDGTPVLDIKPYIPYTDSIPEATGSFANGPPDATNTIRFTDEAKKRLRTLENSQQQLIQDMLRYDLRPAYQQDDPDRIYGTAVFDLQIKWQQKNNEIMVLAIDPA